MIDPLYGWTTTDLAIYTWGWVLGDSELPSLNLVLDISDKLEIESC